MYAPAVSGCQVVQSKAKIGQSHEDTHEPATIYRVYQKRPPQARYKRPNPIIPPHHPLESEHRGSIVPRHLRLWDQQSFLNAIGITRAFSSPLRWSHPENRIRARRPRWILPGTPKLQGEYHTREPVNILSRLISDQRAEIRVWCFLEG
jgi:hypothetical protein